MTPAEIDLLYQAADVEFNQGEVAMLVAPAALLGLIDQYRRMESRLEAVGQYDELHDA